MDDLISRQAAIDAVEESRRLNPHKDGKFARAHECEHRHFLKILRDLPSAQQERLTDDDFETIRIHLNACKEKLCNQRRWKEAEEYQRIIDRFMAFVSAQPERKKGKWINIPGFCTPGGDPVWACSECGKGVHVYGIEHRSYQADISDDQWKACPNCGAEMTGENNG